MIEPTESSEGHRTKRTVGRMFAEKCFLIPRQGSASDSMPNPLTLKLTRFDLKRLQLYSRK